MEEKMRISNGVQARSIDSARKDSGTLWRENKNGDLRGYFSSGASLEVEVWTLGRGPKRKNPRVRSL